MQKIIALVLTLLGFSSAAFAQTYPTAFYYAPTGWAAQSNSPPPPAYNPAYDTTTSAAANYLIQELGANDSFGALTHSTQGSTQTWTETTSPHAWLTTSILFNSGTYSVTSAEDGSTLSCLNAGQTGPQEYDYFLGPNNSLTATNVVPAIATGYTPGSFPLFGQLASLTFTGQVTVNSVSQTVIPSSCADNTISVGLDFNLYDPSANQNIAYNLHLGHLCLAGSSQTSCLHENESQAVWYKVQGIAAAVTDTPVGFTASTLSFTPAGGSPGAGPLVGTGTGTSTGAGTVIFTATDLLTRLKAIVQSNPLKLSNGNPYDTDPTHWKITGMGYTTALWGDSAANISWSGFNVAAACNNTKCN